MHPTTSAAEMTLTTSGHEVLPSPTLWAPAITTVHSGFVYPSTAGPPGFHTSPWPSARFCAYVIEIIASSKSVNHRSPRNSNDGRQMNTA